MALVKAVSAEVGIAFSVIEESIFFTRSARFAEKSACMDDISGGRVIDSEVSEMLRSFAYATHTWR